MSQPLNRIGHDDEGEVPLGIATDHHHKVVRIVFPKPVQWLGLPLRELRQFIALLSQHADELEQGPPTTNSN